mgnify:CR=1 FL=1
MSFNLYWRRNDGIGGHVWLSVSDMLALRKEMLEQGMAVETGGGGLGIPVTKLLPSQPETISEEEIAAALAVASLKPRTLVGYSLWRDWLEFLEGARRNGGLLIRP